MKLTILGAGGQTGLLLTEQALAAGHTVHALVRREGMLTPKPNLKVFIGDATKAADIVTASNGTDVVISTIGQNAGTSALMTNSVNAVIQASKTTGIKRYILMSGIMVKENRLTEELRNVRNAAAKAMFEDKQQSEDILRTSDLNYIIVYPPILTDEPKGSGLRVVPDTEQITMQHTIGRADVAAWILEEAETPRYSRSEVVVSK